MRKTLILCAATALTQAVSISQVQDMQELEVDLADEYDYEYDYDFSGEGAEEFDSNQNLAQVGGFKFQKFPKKLPKFPKIPKITKFPKLPSLPKALPSLPKGKLPTLKSLPKLPNMPTMKNLKLPPLPKGGLKLPSAPKISLPSLPKVKLPNVKAPKLPKSKLPERLPKPAKDVPRLKRSGATLQLDATKVADTKRLSKFEAGMHLMSVAEIGTTIAQIVISDQ